MSQSRSIAALGIVPAGSLSICLFLCGCDRSEQITAYTVPKHESLQTTEYLADLARRHPKPVSTVPIPKRMIGVIIPKEPQFWFLKLEGDAAAVAARENDVREFLKSLRFSQVPGSIDETLEWTTPSGWQQLPKKDKNDIREATLVLDGQPPLEMSVTKLSMQPGLELADQVLANINRWRKQLLLSPIEKSELNDQAEKLTHNSLSAYWVNLEGRAIPKSTSMIPPQAPSGHPKAQEELTPTFEKPAEWGQAPPTMFAKISLQCLESDAKVVITVTPARGDRNANVNRWRSQLKLDPIDADQLKSAFKKVDVGQGTGDLYEMSNGERTILGVIVEDGDESWFVKLDGHSKLAERERLRFDAFLKSLQFK